tara:strand:- start:416 stop:1069 length:654 start_codon:yes stop_codon:yes gene_type:complete
MRYSAAAILSSNFKELFQIAKKIVLKATLYHEWNENWIRQVLEISLQDGKTPDDLSEVPFLDVETNLHQRQINGEVVYTLMVRNSHDLVMIGKHLEDAVVMPDSEFGIQGATLIVRGAPSGVSKMVKGFKEWKAPTSISFVDKEDDDFAEMGALLSESQSHVFQTAHSAGYYDSPRKTSLVEIARELDLSRSTVAGHLRAVEKTMADGLRKSLDDIS